MEHQHLSGTAGAGPDADGGHLQFLGDPGGQFGRNALHQDAETTGILQPQGVLQQLHGRFAGLALDLVAAHAVDGLGGQPEVAHDRDLRVHQGADHGDPLGPALQLHPLGPSAHEVAGIAHGVLHPQVVAQVGHVHQQEGPGPGPGHGFQVVGHHGHGHRQ